MIGRPRRRAGAVALAAWLAACAPDSDRVASAGGVPLAASPAPRTLAEATLGEDPRASAPRPEPGPDALLDVAPDGARLVGSPSPARPDTDEALVYALALEPSAHPLARALGGRRVLAAAFVGARVVTLDADHELRAHALEAGVLVTRTLDTEAMGPLSVAGQRVAYVRGTPPELEAAVADVASGVARAWTAGLAPVWDPALTPDGEALVVVSGATGRPSLYVVRAGAAPSRLVDRGVFPGSSRAPRVIDGALRFEDERGASHVLPLVEVAR